MGHSNSRPLHAGSFGPAQIDAVSRILGARQSWNLITAVVVIRLAGGASAVAAVVLLAKRGQSLLLGMGVDVGTDDEADEVEEDHPGVLGEELLREGEGDRRSDPADLHDRHEAGADGGAHLVEGLGTGNDGHGNQVDGVLDRGDLIDR